MMTFKVLTGRNGTRISKTAAKLPTKVFKKWKTISRGAMFVLFAAKWISASKSRSYKKKSKNSPTESKLLKLKTKSYTKAV